MSGLGISVLGFGFALHAILAAEGGKRSFPHAITSALFLLAGLAEVFS